MYIVHQLYCPILQKARLMPDQWAKPPVIPVLLRKPEGRGRIQTHLHGALHAACTNGQIQQPGQHQAGEVDPVSIQSPAGGALGTQDGQHHADEGHEKEGKKTQHGPQQDAWAAAPTKMPCPVAQVTDDGVDKQAPEQGGEPQQGNVVLGGRPRAPNAIQTT